MKRCFSLHYITLHYITNPLQVEKDLRPTYIYMNRCNECMIIIFKVQLLVSTGEVANYTQVKSDLDIFRYVLVPSEREHFQRIRFLLWQFFYVNWGRFMETNLFHLCRYLIFCFRMESFFHHALVAVRCGRKSFSSLKNQP